MHLLSVNSIRLCFIIWFKALILPHTPAKYSSFQVIAFIIECSVKMPSTQPKKKKIVGSASSKAIDTYYKLVKKPVQVEGHKVSAAVGEGTKLNSSNGKRPRGRPPLTSNKQLKGTAPKPSIVTAQKSSTKLSSLMSMVPPPKSLSSSSSGSTIIPHVTYVKPMPTAHVNIAAAPLTVDIPIVNANVTTTESAAAATAEQQQQQSRLPRPNATEVTNKVLAILMVSEPISLPDLCKQINDIPRESIQSVLEVLQVLGLVIQISLTGYVSSTSNVNINSGTTSATNTSGTKESSSSKSSATNNSVSLFAMAEFAKFSSPSSIAQLTTETAQKIENTREVRARIEDLQALSAIEEDESMQPEMRAAALKQLIGKFLVRSPQLWDDPLYQAVIEYTGNSFQSMKSIY